MSNKGQVAFESLILLLVIMTAAIVITGYYLQTHDDTAALATARTEALSQLVEKKGLYEIGQVKISHSGSATEVTIQVTPTTTLDTDSIENSIKQVTRFKEVNVTIN